MMSIIKTAGYALGLIGAAGLAVFVLMMVVGVPGVMVYAARRSPKSSDARRMNDRLFVASLYVFYTGFFCTLISQLLIAISAD